MPGRRTRGARSASTGEGDGAAAKTGQDARPVPVIRPARIADTEAVVDLWREMMSLHHGLDPRFRPARDGDHLFREELRQWIGDRNTCVLVAEMDRRITGYVAGGVRVNPPVLEPRLVGYITDICVAPDARRCGVGRQLVESLKQWFRERGLRVILLRAAARNEDSQAFWRRVGWQDYMNEMWYEDSSG